MRRQITFIHAADLHLGAPMRGLRSFDPSWTEAFSQAIPQAFRRLIDEALSRAVDFVVFAGDTFDNAQPSYADFSLFIEGMERLRTAGIPVYLVVGNHDPYSSWGNGFASLPENVFVLGIGAPSCAVFARGGEPLAIIAGRSYLNQAWPSEENVAEGISRETLRESTGCETPFTVGVLHTGLDIDPTRSPVAPSDLYARGIDYWACGHIHQHRCLPSDDDPRIVFSGTPQARDRKETGEHGAYLVTLTQGAPNKVEFIALALIEWADLSIDVNGIDAVSDAEGLIAEAAFACNARSLCKRMVFRVSLEGATELHRLFVRSVLEDIRAAFNARYPLLYIDKIVDRTALPLDVDALRDAHLFPGTFMEEIDALRAHRSAGIRELEEGFRERGLALPRGIKRTYGALCSEAEMHVLDLLTRGDER